MNACTTNSGNDLLGRPWTMVLLWIVPWILIIVSGAIANRVTGADDSVLTIIWAFGFTVMGVACLVNARGCGRRHCFYTGPLFLLAALASLLYGLQVLPLGRNGWNWIFDTTVAGSLLACFGLEKLFGKYATRQPPGT